ncbi:MAG: LptF/LptG family permease [Candidatus Saelkia tenebricola]|nr:LptF/LptG family permease [Candidatus Saelkia tenebricola]
MKVIEKYILSKILSPFIFCFILISSIYIIIDISTKLEHIIKHKVALNVVAEYYMYSFPKIVFQIIPLCLLVAAIYSLTKMNKTNEIIAMRACGISFSTILKPYFTIATILVVLMFWNQEKLIPSSYQKLKNIDYILEGKIKEKVYKNITFYAQGNRIIFASKFFPDEKLLDHVVILEQNFNKNVLYKITAESAQYVKDKWILYNLIIYKFNSKGTGIEEAVTLSKKEYDLKEHPKDILITEVEITNLPFKTLMKRISNFRGISDEVVRRLAVELYHKFSFPFTNLVLLFLGLFVGLKSHQASLLKGLGIALLIGFSYYTLDAISYSLGKIGLLPPFIGAFFANILFLSAGSYLLFKTVKN